MTEHDGEDIRDLIGIRSRAAYWFVAFYTIAAATCALSTLDGVDTVWPILVALGVTAAGALGVVMTPGDPLPRTPAVALAAVGPITCALVFVAVPVPLTSRCRRGHWACRLRCTRSCAYAAAHHWRGSAS